VRCSRPVRRPGGTRPAARARCLRAACGGRFGVRAGWVLRLPHHASRQEPRRRGSKPSRGEAQGSIERSTGCQAGRSQRTRRWTKALRSSKREGRPRTSEPLAEHEVEGSPTASNGEKAPTAVARARRPINTPNAKEDSGFPTTPRQAGCGLKGRLTRHRYRRGESFEGWSATGDGSKNHEVCLAARHWTTGLSGPLVWSAVAGSMPESRKRRLRRGTEIEVQQGHGLAGVPMQQAYRMARRA
jgi:hypothetical protein